MTEHDKFCNVQTHGDMGFSAEDLQRLCNCRSIAKVRADEREKEHRPECYGHSSVTGVTVFVCVCALLARQVGTPIDIDAARYVAAARGDAS